MSLLRACKHAVPKSTSLGSTAVLSRAFSSKHEAPAVTRQEPAAVDIASAPTTDAVTADVISGAPGTLFYKRFGQCN